MSNSLTTRCLLWLVVLGLTAPRAADAQVTLAGATEGAASVSNSGSANYAIKLKLPPGVADMVPDIELRYDSQQPNGLVGVGWALSGFPSIRRCPKTLATHGVSEGVKDAMTDAICLDSEVLVRTFGNQLAAGSRYRTERETFSRVTALGILGPNLGPTQFLVEAKSGRKLWFGGTTSSRIVSSTTGVATVWYLRKSQRPRG